MQVEKRTVWFVSVVRGGLLNVETMRAVSCSDAKDEKTALCVACVSVRCDH